MESQGVYFSVRAQAPRDDAGELHIRAYKGPSTECLTAVDDRLKACDLANGDRVRDMQSGSLGIRMLVILAETTFFHLELLHTPVCRVLCGDLQRLGLLRFHWAPPGRTVNDMDIHREETARGLRAPA
jgi:hypothetical protein